MLAAPSVFAQDAPAGPTNPESPLVDYSLTFDAFSAAKLPGDGSNTNLLRNFVTTSDHFVLDASTLTAQLTKGIFGFHVDAGYGEMFKTMNLSDPWGGPNRYFSQAYVSLKPFRHSDFELDFGKFYTSVGAEVPDTGSNYQTLPLAAVHTRLALLPFRPQQFGVAHEIFLCRRPSLQWLE